MLESIHCGRVGAIQLVLARLDNGHQFRRRAHRCGVVVPRRCFPLRGSIGKGRCQFRPEVKEPVARIVAPDVEAIRLQRRRAPTAGTASETTFCAESFEVGVALALWRSCGTVRSTELETGTSSRPQNMREPRSKSPACAPCQQLVVRGFRRPRHRLRRAARHLWSGRQGLMFRRGRALARSRPSGTTAPRSSPRRPCTRPGCSARP